LAELLSITEPRAAQLAPPSLGAFLQMGFRPLYLGGACWAALSIAIWIFVPAMLQGVMQGVLWHAHEMLWGFIATIAVGFLLTAGATWTGINPLHGRPLGLLCCLWALARLAFLVPGRLAFLAGAAAELAYFALAGVAMLRAVLKSRNRRNYGVPWLLFALGVLDALYLLAVSVGSARLILMQFFEAALLCMAIIALLVGRRVIPYFAMRALPGLVLPMHTRSGHWQIAAATLAIALLLFGHGDWAVFPLTLAAAIGLLQTLAWQPWAARHTPLLWILHAGYALLSVGLLVAAARASGQPLRAAWPAHVIAMGGLSVLIIGMITRTALGHLGHVLALDRWMFASFWLMLAAVALRLLALLPFALGHRLLEGAAVCWISAFVLYLWRFAPLMIRPRPDALAPFTPESGRKNAATAINDKTRSGGQMQTHGPQKTLSATSPEVT